MSILTESQRTVNEADDQGCPETCSRRYTQLSRVLGLIDQLAAASRFETTSEISYQYNDRHGTDWHWRTIFRDLTFLEESGLVDCVVRQDFDTPTKTLVWRLNLERSERAEEAAIAVLDGPERVPAQVKGSKLWSVYLADTQTGEFYCVWTELTKSEVLLRWKKWRERKTQCVMVAWPGWLPAPDYLIRSL